MLFLEILRPQISTPGCTSPVYVLSGQTPPRRLKCYEIGCTLEFVVLEFHGLFYSVHHSVLENNAW